MRHPLPQLLAITCLLMGGAVAGCSSDSSGGSTAASSTSPTALVATETWIKATRTGAPMTAVFGQIRNNSDQPVILTAVKTSASDHAEIHEMASVNGSMVMRRKANGLTIAPGTTATLQPGGDHLMVMDLKKPVTPGDTVKVTVTTRTGQAFEFNATAKAFSGARESYHASHTG